jgi:hypothetical protein
MILGSTQTITEIVPGIFLGVKGGRRARKADSLTAICEPIVQKMLGASTSHNPMGFYSLLQGYLCLSPFSRRIPWLW